jgi:hypothetical protein
MKKFKLYLIIFLALLCLGNLLISFFHPNPVLSYDRQLSSLSVGDRYFGHLSLWYYFAQKGDWTNAHSLESKLDPVDIAAYKNSHDPGELKKYVNSLEIKPNKTVEDWLELAQVQYLLGKNQEAVKSTGNAFSLDPIRDDLARIYYQIGR